VDSQPNPDIRIAGYRIEARVGRGGMGEVYRAVQLSLDRRVALKVLAPRLAADDTFRRRFLRESRIAASIDHPSIIPIYETGEDGGLLYIAMRYVDGMDLSTLLRQVGRLAPARALAIMAQVASALDAAHARGLVHRDVKPGNILLAAGPAGTDSHCYLCDFGLIKDVAAQGQSALTATDQFVGTIPYVAPEQIEGRDLDGRADVYSLGCVLFHCLTGSVPFERMNDIEVVFAHMREPPPPVSSRAPGLPRSMDAIVARAMAKNRDDRWPTCSALITAMRAEVRTATPIPPTSADQETRSMVRPPTPAAPPPATRPLAPGSPAAGPPASGPPAAGPPAAGPPASGPPAAAPTVAGFPAAAPTVAGSPAPTAAAATEATASPTEAPLTEPLVPGRGSPVAPAPPPTWPDPGPGHGPAPPPQPPPAGRPDRARPASGPPEGEPSGPGGGVPTAVHRGDGARPPGRRWLLGVAAIVLPVAAYFATTQFLTKDRPRVVAAPETTVAATTRPPARSRCPGGFTRPEVGTAARTAPLAAIRAQMGWSEQFYVDEMRTWRGSDGQRLWYVKAHQQGNPSRRGRWLVGQQEDGQRLVLASAEFDTKGYAERDWEVTEGREAPSGVAGCLAGT
jgi:tRNA A-37 threonylcarbamoyl transferase component Bud32